MLAAQDFEVGANPVDLGEDQSVLTLKDLPVDLLAFGFDLLAVSTEILDTRVIEIELGEGTLEVRLALLAVG